MTSYVPDEGKEDMLNEMLKASGTRPQLIVCLFQNNFTPDQSSTKASFTESTFGGYAHVTLTRASWGTPTVTSNVAESLNSGNAVFTCTSGSAQNAYGYYVYSDQSNKVWAFGLFDSPRSMAPGATETIDPLAFFANLYLP